MKCEHCGKENKKKKSVEYETRVFHGLEVTKVVQHNTSFNDVVIPEGFELLTLAEGVVLLNNESFVEWISFRTEKNDFFIEQPFKNNEGKRAAWLGCIDDYFFLGGSNNLDYYSAARGVVLKRVKGDD